jgi:hypothetical protein
VYSCKGSKNAGEWNKVLESCADTVVRKDAEVSSRKVVYKFMCEINRSRDTPRDEAEFSLAGGQLTYNSVKVKGCPLRHLDPAPNESTALFTLSNIKHPYTSRPTNQEGLNLYQFCVQQYKSAPSFYGYDDHCAWPLGEEYSKAMLFVYHPHRCNHESLAGNGSVATNLEQVMNSKPFPPELLVDILRKKNSWAYQQSALAESMDAQPDSTPSGRRTNTVFDEAAAMAAAFDVPTDGDEQDAELTEDLFRLLPDGGEDYNWWSNTNEAGMSWLEDHKKAFYEDQLRAPTIAQPPTLHREDFYRPENAKGESQKVLIASLLLSLRRSHNFQHNHSNSAPGALPPSFRSYIQGNPGTGKSFIIHTMQNIV